LQKARIGMVEREPQCETGRRDAARPPCVDECRRIAERNEELLRLADALTALPDPQREVVVLKHLRGWTLQRMADHIGRTVPAVASLLRRGLEELRRRLAPKE
jgi:RNA polymerase sigma factor (sigma-70 family)